MRTISARPPSFPGNACLEGGRYRGSAPPPREPQPGLVVAAVVRAADLVGPGSHLVSLRVVGLGYLHHNQPETPFLAC